MTTFTFTVKPGSVIQDCFHLSSSHFVYFSRKLINKTNKLSRRRRRANFQFLSSSSRKVLVELVQILCNTRSLFWVSDFGGRAMVIGDGGGGYILVWLCLAQ